MLGEVVYYKFKNLFVNFFKLDLFLFILFENLRGYDFKMYMFGKGRRVFIGEMGKRFLILIDLI